MATVTHSRIEPKKMGGNHFFVTTVKCNQEVMIPCRTIERAILFKKLYEDFERELWSQFGWASWASKEKVDP
jgi:hypothetical protein